MSNVPRDFELSSGDILLNVWISVGAAGVSCLLCLCVLGGAAWIYSKPWSRHAINRVSFRLLLWSMVFEVFYDIAFIAVGLESAFSGASEAVCATGVYFMISTLGVVNYLCTCIAVNLMLIVCFKINPIEQRLEKWYVGISVFVGIVVPIGPAIKRHFGYDPVLRVCWIQARTQDNRIVNFIVDLYLWQIISCLIATLAVIATLVSLFHRRRHINTRPDDAEDFSGSASIIGHLQNRFLKIAMLISLYPIALILVNGIITIGDLYISAEGGVKTNGVYGLYCIYYFLYGGRGIVFACLGIFVDPCFRDGLRAAVAGAAAQDMVPIVNDPKQAASLLEILGAPSPVLDYKLKNITASGDMLTTWQERSRQGSKASIELVAALSRLPAKSPGHTLPLARPESSHRRTDFSRHFSGVQAGALPPGLTDDVDVNLRLHSPIRHVDEQGRWNGGEVINIGSAEDLIPLDPDLPDAEEEERRRRKAEQIDQEEAIRQFQETQAQL